MNGPFGVEVISKSTAAERRRRDNQLDSAKGVGAATAGAGLLAGGIPGETGDSTKWDPVHRRPANGSKGGKRPKPKDVMNSLKGGILGYRIDAHQAELDGLRAKAAASDANPAEKIHEFNRGFHDYGGHEPEKKIIGHLKRARAGSHVALGAGAATVAGAAYLKNKNQVKKFEISKAKKKERYRAQVAGGATITGGSLAGGKLLESQGNKWAQTAADEYDKAKKIIPEMGGWDNVRSDHNVRHVKPKFDEGAINDLGNIKEGNSAENLRQAGVHRGNASKARYFAHTYGNNAKWVRRIGVPVGVAGMALGSKNVQNYTDKKRNKIADTIRPNVSK